MTKRYRTFLILAAILSVSACASVKKEIGVGRNSPDEFMVLKRAPLTLPPDYNLRPPANAADAAPASANTAKEIIFGETEKTTTAGASEKALLDKMGSAALNPDIRRQIDEDNGYIALENRSVAEKLIFWSDEQIPSSENMPDSTVDPAAEAERLKKNKEEGKPVTEGVVPVIEKKKGTLDRLF